MTIEQIIAQAAQQIIPNNSALSSVSSVDLELLKNQIELLQQLNQPSAQLVKSFDLFVASIRNLFYIFLGIVGLLGAFAVYIFKNTLDETIKISKDIAQREAYNSIGTIINREIEIVTRSIDKEKVIDITKVNYLLVGGANEPDICKLIRKRGFKSVEFYVN